MTTATIHDGWSADQLAAIEQVNEWHASGRRQLIVGGLAGTGKTRLAAQLPRILGVSAQFAAPTGRAALMLNLKQAAGARTIHSIFYSRREVQRCWVSDEETGEDGRCRLHPAGERFPECLAYPHQVYSPAERPRVPDGTSLLIVDEGSMVDREMWDLMTGCGIPVIAFGDHGQLPPVRGTFSLMEHPDIRLETIHRQAQGSPIIRLAHWAREHGSIPPGAWDAGLAGFAEKITMHDMRSRGGIGKLVTSPDNMVVSWTNPARQSYTGQIRRDHGMPPYPVPGDKVICLKNAWQEGVVNGERGDVLALGQPFCRKLLPVRHPEHRDCTVTTRHEDHLTCECMVMYPMSAAFEGGRGSVWSGYALQAQFNAIDDLARRMLFDSKGTYLHPGALPAGTLLLDYGYALTCHKAQGGQADRVVVIDGGWREDKRRLLYTAVTRAERSLTVVGA